MNHACPKCGSDAGYVEHWRCTHRQWIDFDGEPVDCIAERESGGRRKYCAQCDKDITSYVLGLTDTPADGTGALTQAERDWVNGKNDGEPLIYDAAIARLQGEGADK